MPKSTPGTFVVSIRCLACGISVMLHQVKFKSATIKLSSFEKLLLFGCSRKESEYLLIAYFESGTNNSSTSLTINTSNNMKPVMIAGNNAKDLSSSSLTDVIVIGDGDFKTESPKPRLRIGTVTLYDNDRQTILDGKWLWGTHLSAMQLLLRAQFPHLKGLEDTALVLCTGNTISPASLQILHVNGNH